MVFFRLLCLCTVKMAYRILQVEGHVLSCQSKQNDNKRLQKKICNGFINFVCACKFLK